MDGRIPKSKSSVLISKKMKKMKLKSQIAKHPVWIIRYRNFSEIDEKNSIKIPKMVISGSYLEEQIRFGFHIHFVSRNGVPTVGV